MARQSVKDSGAEEPKRDLVAEEMESLQVQAEDIGLTHIGEKKVENASLMELRMGIQQKLDKSKQAFKDRPRVSGKSISLDLNDGLKYAGRYRLKCNYRKLAGKKVVEYPPGQVVNVPELDARRLLRHEQIETPIE